MTNSTDILNAKEVAASIGKNPQFVTAMKRAGYRFRYGRLTTRKHALEWLEANPGFIPSHYLAPYWTKASEATLESQTA
jgi:hypothetical protein